MYLKSFWILLQTWEKQSFPRSLHILRDSCRAVFVVLLILLFLLKWMSIQWVVIYQSSNVKLSVWSGWSDSITCLSLSFHLFLHFVGYKASMRKKSGNCFWLPGCVFFLNICNHFLFATALSAVLVPKKKKQTCSSDQQTFLHLMWPCYPCDPFLVCMIMCPCVIRADWLHWHFTWFPWMPRQAVGCRLWQLFMTETRPHVKWQTDIQHATTMSGQLKWPSMHFRWKRLSFLNSTN